MNQDQTLSLQSILQAHPTISDLHDAYDAKKLSPSQVIEAALQAARQSSLSTHLCLREQDARTEALAHEQTLHKEGKVPRKAKPLFGVPVGVKDNLHVKGVPTTCASKILEGYHPPFSATAVVRLQEAGGIVTGKLNLDEFAMGGSNENSAFGAVKHPTHPDRVPGGSSGGSAAAVAAGECWVSLGSDTGGSVRLPASFCGVWGFKPTYGRVSRSGLVAFASSLDQVGPLARNGADLKSVYQIMAGPDPLDSTTSARSFEFDPGRKSPTSSLTGARIGVPQEFFEHALHPDVDRAIHRRLESWKAQGAQLIPISLPHSKYSVSVYYLIAVSEASSNLSRFDGVRFGVRPKEADQRNQLKEFYEEVRSLFGAEVKRRILLGTFALSAGYSQKYYHRACLVRRLISDDFVRAFQQVDWVVSPVSPGPAFKLGAQVHDPLTLYLNDIYTIPPNLAGLPALSLPVGVTGEGLPIGLQIIGPRFSDDRLLDFAITSEKVGAP
jgi:aspartyl-tRNA(Asn)/glutamyl-tRNA(Gln) amidotransferase subunit A